MFPSKIDLDEYHPVGVDTATFMLSRVDGPLDDPETWEKLGQTRGYVFYPFFGETSSLLGEIIHRKGRAPIIVYNTFVGKRTQAKVIIHEIAHAILLEDDRWRPIAPFLNIAYHQESNEVRHVVARDVETLIISLWPDEVDSQAQNKRPMVRTFKRFKIPPMFSIPAREIDRLYREQDLD